MIRIRFRFCAMALVLCTSIAEMTPPVAAQPSDGPDVATAEATPQKARQAVVRGLEFLINDAAEWRAERTCSTCHHGNMTVWALSEAKRQGYEVTDETLADTIKWTKDRLLERIDLPRDTRPGWSMINTPAIYMSVMALTVHPQDAVNADELKRIAAHLLRHQEADGSWSWSSAPPKNRPPPFFESDEVATLLSVVALGPQLPSDPNEKSEIRDARNKGIEWLAKSPPNDTTQAATMRLLRSVCDGQPATAMQPAIDELLARRNIDGGWGQLKDALSDAYATGQVLYVLNLAGLNSNRDEIQKAALFLANSQQPDGSWTMIPRAHPDATPSGNPVPITYFGSAWGTLGLARNFPK